MDCNSREKTGNEVPARNRVSNSLHMPDETVEQFINRLNDINACMSTILVRV